MKKRIFLYYMVLIVIGVSITGFFTSQQTQKFYKQEVEFQLRNSAKLIRYQVIQEIAKGNVVDYNYAAINYAEILNQALNSSNLTGKISSRVTFIDYTGNVIGESETDYRLMENHLNRREVEQAIKGELGKDIRLSNTLGIDFLYIAVPIKEAETILRISTPLIKLEEISKTILLYSIAGIFCGLVITSLLAYKFSSSMIKPVKALISTAKEIAAGKYSKRVYVSSKDELNELSITFNKMALNLERTVSDLTDKNLKMDSILNNMINGIVAVDEKFRIILINSIACNFFNINKESDVLNSNIIEPIRNNQINGMLKETIINNVPIINEITIGPPEDKVFRVYTTPIKSKDSSSLNSGGILSIHDITNVKKLEQIRTEFVSNVTHELKTPLTSIRGFVETLRNGAINDTEVSDKFLEIIDIEAERLYMLINDILQLSEIETRQKDINIGTYNLKTIITEVISILQSVAAKKGISIAFEADDTIKIEANRDRIKQMLINLVDNAIKYNVENGSIIINAYKAQGKIVIIVKDTGIGIPPEHISRIFERFYRVDKGRSRSIGGTGLGLSIVKHIVNLYSGDIKLNSEPGKGTEFIIQIPV